MTSRFGSTLRSVVDGLSDKALGLPPGTHRVDVVRDVPVTMPDGVVLIGDLYRPAGEQPRPAVLVRTPYGRGRLGAEVFATPLARHGLPVFLQSTRGTAGSGGMFRPFTTEREDGLTTLAWLREQPWCDGRVASVGASYLGHTQWSVAPFADPPLVAASTDVTASRMTLAFFHGGAPGLRNALVWTAGLGTQERGSVRTMVMNEVRVRRTLDKLPLQSADLDVAGAPVAFWRDFTGHSEPGDPFWADADSHDADLARMPPTSMVTGWWDLFLAGQVDDFAALQSAGVATRLTIGPWRHGELGQARAIVQDNLSWLSEQLEDGPAEARPPVRLHIQHGDGWRDFETWPPPAESRSYFLGADGVLGERISSGSDSFVYDPADPTPTAGGPLLAPPAKQADNTQVESRPDVLIYTSDPLDTDLDVVGPVTARIALRTSLADADLFVRVCDVETKADGTSVSRNVTDGIRRLQPSTVPAADVTVDDSGVLTVELPLFPTGYRFRAGHSIRVQVAGGAFPRFARNFGTGESFATGVSGRTCEFEILHDERHPSVITLPVLMA